MAVLVILAIIVLIVTPLVMSIIKKARISADKRSIDAYGRSVELAIANYLLDNGDLPTSIGDLQVEHTGPTVSCTTTQLKSDYTVYLAGCTVGGRSVDYTYGKEETITYNAYSVGDEVDYYVIKDSDSSESTVTLLKAEPLTVDEVNTYGVGHINRYTDDSAGTAYDRNGYGEMAYYASETCGYNGSYWVETECKSDYELSEVKYVVDAWKTANASVAIGARLISKDEIDSNFEFEEYDVNCGGCVLKSHRITATWMYNSNYNYWTNTPCDGSSTHFWIITMSGNVASFPVYFPVDNVMGLCAQSLR